MLSNEIKLELKEFFKREFPNPGIDLKDDTNLLDDWFIDSFGIVNTTLFLEQRFGIEISRSDINPATFRNIEILSKFIADRLNNLP
ncbi:MAG: acyl carrier protein [Nitrospinae bacterium]|nr:acyl carrier protein [Nitrospinota bacterium]